MEKTITCAPKFLQFTRIGSSLGAQNSKPTSLLSSRRIWRPSLVKNDSGRIEEKKMDQWDGGRNRVPLAEVVAELVEGWFEDALEAAEDGDSAMQVLVGRMYCFGVGVPKDVQKGRDWISEGSKTRLSAWELGRQHPGYDDSGSDSDESKDENN